VNRSAMSQQANGPLHPLSAGPAAIVPAENRRSVEACAVLSGALCLLVLVGWRWGTPVLAGQWGSSIPTAPSSALALALLSAALFCRARWPVQAASRRFVAVAICIVLSFSLLVLQKVVTGIDLGLEWTLSHTNELFGAVPLGRMSPLTAISLLLEAAALTSLLAAPRWHTAPSIAILIAGGAITINGVVLIGYAYGTPVLYGGPIIPVALPTAVALLLLGLGQVNLAAPCIESLHSWSSTSLRGSLLRAFLPGMFLVLVGGNWVESQLGSVLPLSPALWHSLTVLASGALIVILTWRMANRTAQSIERAQEQVHSLARFPDEDVQPVLRVGSDGSLLYCNRGSRSLLEAWQYRQPGPCVPSPERGLVAQALASGASQEREVACGKTIYRLVFVPIVEMGYVNIYGQDISEQKLAQEQLEATLAHLQRSNTELEQFAYVASHDLQEPLRMVTSYVQLLQRRYQSKLDADADDFINYAVDGAKRMQRLINDLLALSRVGTRGRDMIAMLSETALMQALASLDMFIKDNGAHVTYDTLPAVIADEGQLTQLFQNLISNAVKFHGESAPDVHISAVAVPGPDGAASGMWQFSVRDNGIGIDAQYYKRIFIIFQRLHSRDSYAGTGIGLAVCKKIVERHSGRIWVESQPGQGTTFYFTLKAAPAATALRSDDAN
jgi:signal transduction histidine kinase